MFLFGRQPKARANKPSHPTFPYPLTPCPPIAIFEPYFDCRQSLELASARTLAAPMERIRALDPGTWSADYPLVAFTSIDGRRVSDDDRHYVWSKFGVSVFEYMLDASGAVVARECEAREGLHLERPLEERYEAEIAQDPCACGRSGQRLMHIAPSPAAKAII